MFKDHKSIRLPPHPQIPASSVSTLFIRGSVSSFDQMAYVSRKISPFPQKKSLFACQPAPDPYFRRPFSMLLSNQERSKGPQAADLSKAPFLL
jgi:hypothetical protein